MNIGPVEYITVTFPGNRFSGEIMPALQKLVTGGIINIIDLVIVRKDGDDSLTLIELGEMDEDLAALLAPLHLELLDLLTEEDIQELGEHMPANSTTAMMVWEDKWASEFAETVRSAGGVLVDNERVPHDHVVALIEEAQARLSS